MKFEINKIYDLEIQVGKGSVQRVIKEHGLKFMGIVNTTDKTDTIQFERTLRKGDQKPTIAVPRNLIKNM